MKLTQRQINSLRLHAQSKFEEEDFKAAKRCFVEIIEQMEKFDQTPPTSILFNTAMCYFKIKNYERVEQYLIMMLKIDPFSALSCFYLGICYKLAMKGHCVGMKNNIKLEDIPTTDYFQEAIDCIQRQPSHEFVPKNMKISPHRVDIDTIHYQPLGLDMDLTIHDCAIMKNFEFSDSLPMSIDFKIFRMKVIHSAGLQDRHYMKPHITIRKDSRKIKEIKDRVSVDSGVFGRKISVKT